MDIEVDPEYLFWVMIDGPGGPDLHGIIMAHVPDEENLLAYEVLCGAKGKWKMRPYQGEPKCEICERKRRSLNIETG